MGYDLQEIRHILLLPSVSASCRLMNVSRRERIVDAERGPPTWPLQRVVHPLDVFIALP